MLSKQRKIELLERAQAAVAAAHYEYCVEEDHCDCDKVEADLARFQREIERFTS